MWLAILAMSQRKEILRGRKTRAARLAHSQPDAGKTTIKPILPVVKCEALSHFRAAVCSWGLSHKEYTYKSQLVLVIVLVRVS